MKSLNEQTQAAAEDAFGVAYDKYFNEDDARFDAYDLRKMFDSGIVFGATTSPLLERALEALKKTAKESYHSALSLGESAKRSDQAIAETFRWIYEEANSSLAEIEAAKKCGGR